MAILIYRRRTVGPVFSATTRMDKVMYVFLAAVILLGLCNTVAGEPRRRLRLPRGRLGLVPRHLPLRSPHPDLMAEAPLGFQLHALVALALFALWPFTRLVHVFSAPLGYLTRPYIVYRSRDDPARQPPAAPRLGPGRLTCASTAGAVGCSRSRS